MEELGMAVTLKLENGKLKSFELLKKDYLEELSKGEPILIITHSREHFIGSFHLVDEEEEEVLITSLQSKHTIGIPMHEIIGWAKYEE